MHDLAAAKPDLVAQLKADYDAWFNDVTGSRDYAVPSRIFIGAAQENPVLLTRQDWRGRSADWSPKGIGYWEVNVVASKPYEIKLRFDPLTTDGEAVLTCGAVSARESIKARQTECVFKSVQLSPGPNRLEATIAHESTLLGVNYIEVKRLD
jgi:hypothetical protein